MNRLAWSVAAVPAGMGRLPVAHFGPHNLLEWLIYGGVLAGLTAFVVALLVDARSGTEPTPTDEGAKDADDDVHDDVSIEDPRS